MRVLVVEDETALAQRLSVSLGAAGYVVDGVSDGARADFLVTLARRGGPAQRADAVVAAAPPQGWRAIRWRQGGTHTGTFALPGQPPVPATGKSVDIPWHYFFYRVRGNRLVEIRPEPVPGGAPPGILEQIGTSLPPLFLTACCKKGV